MTKQRCGTRRSSGIPASGIPASGIPASGTPGTKYPMFYGKNETANRDAASALAFAKLVEKLESDQDGVVVAAATQLLNRVEGTPVQVLRGADKDGNDVPLFPSLSVSIGRGE